MASVLETSPRSLSIQNTLASWKFWVAGNIPTFGCNSQKSTRGDFHHLSLCVCVSLSPPPLSVSSSTHCMGWGFSNQDSLVLGFCGMAPRLLVESCVIVWFASGFLPLFLACSLSELSKEYKTKGEMVWDKV